MTTINNNLTIEQMREIVESAPDGATHIIESFKSLDYLKFDGSWWILYEYTNAPSEWVLTCFRTILAEFKESIQRLDDLRTAIAKHDEDHCNHEWNDMTSNGDNYRSLVCKHCDSTKNYLSLDEDHVTDIRNHLSPSTLVVDL